MIDLKSFISSYKSGGLKFVTFITDDNSMSELDSTKVLQINLHVIQQLLKMNSLVFLCELAINYSWLQFVESYLICRRKPAFKNISVTSNDSLSLKLDQLVFLVYLRLCSPSEVESISSQLPSTPISSPAAGKQAVGSMENAENADPNQKITDQYKGVLNAMQFLRVPYVMDIISILGDGGCSLSARLISGLHSLRPSFAKESADAFKEVVNALNHVQQAVIILSRKMLLDSSNKTKSILGKAKVDTKIANLTVVTLQRSQSSQEKANKQSPVEELSFLCEFAADIVYSASTFLAALSEAGLSTNTSSLFCLGGTRLTGKLGQPFALALRNLYEVVLPLLARCLKALPDSDSQQITSQLGVMQLKSLSTLHCLLRDTHHATDALLQAQQKSFEELFDSMDVLREDGIEWLALLQGYDPLGMDPLVLTATSGNLGETGSSKVLHSASGTATATAGKGVVGGVVHTVDETEVLRGAFISDLMKVYGTQEVEQAVRNSSVGDPGAEQITYIVKSLQTEESFLRSRSTVAQKATSESTPTVPAMAAKNPSSGKSSAALMNSMQSNTEAVGNIKTIFPDLGEGFIEACIGAYKGNVEEVIDALLTDNLQPSLLVLDRSLQKMWIGKGGGGAQGAISLDAQRRDASVVYKAVEDASFKQLQMERIKKMEAQQEYDHMLLTREYNDDYDDQYDEFNVVDMLRAQPSGGESRHSQHQQTVPAIPLKRPVTAPAAVAPEILNRRERRKNKGALPNSGAGEGIIPTVAIKAAPVTAPLSKSAILQQMAEMKRLNSLTRDAEVEAAYWDSMRNTNHHSSVHSGKNSWKAELNKAEEVAATTTAATPPHPQRGAQHASVSTQGPGGVQRGVQRSGQAKSSGAGGITKSVDGDRIGQSQPQQQKQQGKQQGKQQPSAGTGPKEGRNPSSNKQKDGDAGQSVDGSVASGDSSKKHRSKPFDKHHQKDRAIRKFSHFAPSS